MNIKFDSLIIKRSIVQTRVGSWRSVWMKQVHSQWQRGAKSPPKIQSGTLHFTPGWKVAL